MKSTNQIIYLQDEIFFLKEKVKVLEETKEQMQSKHSESQRELTRGEKAPPAETTHPGTHCQTQRRQ
jgi:hypothetical protein